MLSSSVMPCCVGEETEVLETIFFPHFCLFPAKQRMISNQTQSCFVNIAKCIKFCFQEMMFLDNSFPMEVTIDRASFAIQTHTDIKNKYFFESCSMC